MKGTILPKKTAHQTFPFGHATVRAQRDAVKHGDGSSAGPTAKGTNAGKIISAKHTAKGLPVVKLPKSKLG